MKLVSYLSYDGEERAGLFLGGQVADLEKWGSRHGISLPSDMNAFLREGENAMDRARELELKLASGFEGEQVKKMLAPVPHPASCRDGYAFRQHVFAARRNRGVSMIAEFDQYPIFYFTNHNAVFGEGEVDVELDHMHRLDFELEWAAVIGRKGRNIDARDADAYIAGYTIMNDFSARTLQMEEMLLNLGPAKGKDFATTIGPWLVTPDELEQYRIDTPGGALYNLEMKAVHNGNQVSYGNTREMSWTFAEIVERASYGADIFPGDVIGSGTVGTGCYLELNGTHALEAKEKGEEFAPVWLKNGDSIELEVTGLGKLVNRIRLTGNDVSILKKKKI